MDSIQIFNMELQFLASQHPNKDEYKDLPSQILSSTNMIPSLFEYESTDLGFDPSAFDLCDLGQACDQQCDPSSVVPCTSVDANPCFDPTCSPRCEVDGMDTICYENHDATGSLQSPQGYQFDSNTSVNCRQDPARSSAHAQPLPNINRFTSVNSAGNTDMARSSGLTACFHPEHAGTGCINPQLLSLRSTGDPGILFADPNSCCCDDPTHIPSLQDAVPMGRQRQRNTIRRERKNMHRAEARVPSSNTPDTSTGHSRLSNEQEQAARLMNQSVSLPFHQHVSTQLSESVAASLYRTQMIGCSTFKQPFQPAFMPQSGSSQTSSLVYTPSTDSSLSPSLNPQCRWISKETGNPCGMSWNSAAELQAHIEQTHLPQRRRSGNTERLPIVCCWEHCEHAGSEKPFRQNQHLKDHIRTHTQHKPYECVWLIDEHGTKCGKGFGEKKALDSHLRTHTKEKPFKCRLCDRSFAHQSTLSAHQAKHEQVEKKYRCPKCGHMDNDRANLSRHWDTHYPPRYMCKLCGKTFSKKANALRHLNNRSCKSMPQNFSDADLKESIFCQPREKGELDFAMFENKGPDHTNAKQ